MKLDAEDIRELRPVIQTVVQSVLDVARHVLRDCRLRGEIQASKIGKKNLYARDELLKFLERNRTER